MADALDQQRMHDIRKSKVRICVTYAMTTAYIVGCTRSDLLAHVARED